MRLRQWSAIEVDRLVDATAPAVGAVLPPAWQGHIEQPVFQRGRFASEIGHISDLVRFGEALSTGRHATIIALDSFRDQMSVVQESFCTKILAFVMDPASQNSSLCNLKRGDRQAIWTLPEQSLIVLRAPAPGVPL